MKTYLFDFTNYGIVYVNDDTKQPKRWTLTLLRSCILDTNLGKVSPLNPCYQQLNNNSIQNEFFYMDRGISLNKGEMHEFNHIYREKQRRAGLMMPVLDLLVNCIQRRSFNMLDDFGLPIDDTIALEISQCNPDNDSYSQGVISYAQILGITNYQAYQELSIDYKTHHAVKMRSYAQVNKYLPQVRSIRSQADADLLVREITNTLLNDTWI
jgi:hypothetical protein